MNSHLPIFFLLILILCFSCKVDEPTEQERLGPPLISHIIPTQDTVGGILTLVGTNFSEEPSNNVLLFGSQEAFPFEATSDNLKVIVPDGAESAPIELRVYEQTTTSKDIFEVLKHHFEEVAPLPVRMFEPISFVFGNRAYVGFGKNAVFKKSEEFWEYDQEDNRWLRRTPFQDLIGDYDICYAFALNGRYYLGGTAQNTPDTADSGEILCEYDPVNQGVNCVTMDYSTVGYSVPLIAQGKLYLLEGGRRASYYVQPSLVCADPDQTRTPWPTVSAEYPGKGTFYLTGITMADQLYIGGGVLNPWSTDVSRPELWRYDPVQDEWAKMASHPSYEDWFRAGGNHLEGIGYFFTSTGWRYLPTLNQWFSFPIPSPDIDITFTLAEEGNIYLLHTSSDNRRAWKFDPRE